MSEQKYKVGGKAIYESACNLIDSDNRICNAPTYRAIAYARQHIANLDAEVASLAEGYGSAHDEIETLQSQIAEREAEVERLREANKRTIELIMEAIEPPEIEGCERCAELEAEVERYKEALKICAEYLEGPCNIPNDCPACKAWDAVQAVLQEGE